jgi:hypothetical protein
LFQYILNYLRDGVKLVLPEERRDQLSLQQEARYYCMDGLYEKLSEALVESQPTLAKCMIPVLMSEVHISGHYRRCCSSGHQEEEATAIESTRHGKPMIKLVYSRANNKFSYTSPSDDSMLRNLELFGPLAVLSASDASQLRQALDEVPPKNTFCKGDNGEKRPHLHMVRYTTCVLASQPPRFFYGNGRLVAEICCSSMVYQAEKKLTKIEFPDTRLAIRTLMCPSDR